MKVGEIRVNFDDARIEHLFSYVHVHPTHLIDGTDESNAGVLANARPAPPGIH